MPTTTIVKDSQIGDEWIKAAVAANPIRIQPNGDGMPTIQTGPVRLSFPFLLAPSQDRRMKNGDLIQGKYETKLLFPPIVNFQPLREEYDRLCHKHWANAWDPANKRFYGLHNPFRDQVEIRGAGFTPGGLFMTGKSGTDYPPAVLDTALQPITDASRVYGGVWAIAP